MTINLGLGLELFKKVQVAAQYGWGVTEAVKYPSINDVKAKTVPGRLQLLICSNKNIQGLQLPENRKI
ncbi:MAG: hypothetical protein ACLSG8_02985 [Barnesiella sp.]